MYVEVAVCLPLTRTFVYRIDEPVEVGCRVSVPFRKREMDGFVVGFPEKASGVEALPVNSVTDSSPLLRPEIFELCRWISKYYVSPFGEVLKAALPPGIKGNVMNAPSATSAAGLGPLPRGEGAAKRRVRAGQDGRYRRARPHPALRATFSRREQDSTQTVLPGSGRFVELYD